MIIFRNEGEIDINAITTMGVSVKPSTNNPIGYFGTGFKFSVAVLLRYGCSITVFSGLNRYDFSTRLQEIRGSDFEVVIMAKNKGKPVQLGFTTQLGRNWLFWQAYRELYCNCLDENGNVSSGSGYGLTKGIGGETVIMVKGDDFEKIHFERDKFLLNKENKELVYANSDVEIYRGPNDGLFYRGVKVTTQKTRFTYNILANSTLTEDRTLAEDYYTNVYIAKAFLEMENAEAISTAIARGDDSDKTYENKLYFSYVSTKPSEAFKEAIKNTRKAPHGVSDSALKKYYDSTTEVSELYNVLTLNSTQQKQFDRAKTFLDMFGLIPHLNDYQLIFADNFSKRQTGEQFKNMIVLNISAFDKGTKQVAMTLFEEYIHAHEKLDDMTRDMQNHLFALIMNCIEQRSDCII